MLNISIVLDSSGSISEPHTREIIKIKLIEFFNEINKYKFNLELFLLSNSIENGIRIASIEEINNIPFKGKAQIKNLKEIEKKDVLVFFTDLSFSETSSMNDNKLEQDINNQFKYFEKVIVVCPLNVFINEKIKALKFNFHEIYQAILEIL